MTTYVKHIKFYCIFWPKYTIKFDVFDVKLSYFYVNNLNASG